MEKIIERPIPVNSNQPFGEYIDFIIRQKLANDSQVARLLDLYNIGFAATKKGNLEDAALQFQLANSYIQQSTAETLAWVTALSGGNLSYYYYKKGDYATARQQTHTNIEALQQIMEKNACWGLFWGEIQQLHNLGRISLKENNIDNFLEECTETFPKMYFALAEWKGTKIVESWEWELFTTIGYDMFVQVFSETIHSILFARQGNEVVIKKTLQQFLRLLHPFNYAKLADLPEKFKLLHRFILLVDKIVNFGTDTLDEEDLQFINETKKNKDLSKVLYNLLISIN